MTAWKFFTAHNDSVLTDIADFLVQKDHISFRSAHNIISNISKSRNGIADAPISLRILNNASIKISGKKTSLTHEELMKLQSPIVSYPAKTKLRFTIIPGMSDNAAICTDCFTKGYRPVKHNPNIIACFQELPSRAD